MDSDIETLATALYVKIDDMLRDWPDLAPERPPGGFVHTLGDAELLAMAVMSALLGFTSDLRSAANWVFGGTPTEDPQVSGLRLAESNNIA